MKRLLTIPAALWLLATALTITGCTPMPYQDPYYSETIVIYDPGPYVPEPPPIIIVDSQPPPPPTRYTPLTKQQDSGTPRTKTPRGDRGENRPRTKHR